MWLVPPKVLCRRHLLGEHYEMHMFLGSYRKNISLKGFINNGMLDPSCMLERHEELVEEMTKRGYDHDSPIERNLCLSLADDYKDYESCVDVDGNLDVLKSRCDSCTIIL
jgi:hypothetical protein